MDINDIKHLATERIYLIPDSSEGQLGYVWCDDPAPGFDMDPSEAVEYVRKDVHDDIIKRQASSAKIGMNAAKAVAGSYLEQAKRMYAECSPEALESEREANAQLTERIAQLEQERDTLAYRNTGLIQQCRAAERQRDEQLSKLRALNHGSTSEAWHWMGNGEDHLESLVCPILISAENLKAIFSDRDDYRAAEELQINLREKMQDERDALAAHVERLRAALNYCSEYLYGSHLNTIGHGSKAHMEMVSALEETPATSLALLNQEPEAWMYQHEETGRIGFIEQDEVDRGFERNNPRLQLICPLYRRKAERGA
ncbi:hypothetical protein SAMN04488142_0017 [Halomonas sp. hl-4]|nr:hypothetical protein SAMN04488142_0017 [Halomonas sp. hl-4]